MQEDAQLVPPGLHLEQMISERIDAKTKNAGAYAKQFRLLEDHVHLPITRVIGCMDMENIMTSTGNWLQTKKNVLERNILKGIFLPFLSVLHFAKDLVSMPECLLLEPMTTEQIDAIPTKNVSVCVNYLRLLMALVPKKITKGIDCTVTSHNSSFIRACRNLFSSR